MKKCPYCSSEILDDAEFCLYCMRPLKEKEVIKHKANKLHIYAVTGSILIAVLLCFLSFLFIGQQQDVPPDSSQSSSQQSESTGAVTTSAPNSSDADSSSGTSSSGSSKVPDSSGSSSSSGSSNTQKPQSSETTIANNSGDVHNKSDETVEENDSPVISTPTQNSSSVSSNTQEQEPLPKAFNTNAVSGGIEITGINIENTSGIYEIPSQLEGKTVIGIADEAFKYESVKKITLPSSLEYIGEQSFSNCYQLTEIVIPKNVTAIKNGAFVNCKKLSKIYISSKNIEIHTNAFPTYYQRDVELTIYASSSIMTSNSARILWDAQFEEWNG